MLLRSITQHVKDQNWFAVALDFLIVVVGILIAFQITNWNEKRSERSNEVHYLERLDTELDVILTRLIDGKRVFGSSVRSINLLLKAHRDYASDLNSNLPNNDVLGAANRLFSLLDLTALNLSGDKVEGGLSGLEIIRFDRQTFLENAEMQGALSILLIAQINQYSLLEQQLKFAQEIETLIAREH